MISVASVPDLNFRPLSYFSPQAIETRVRETVRLVVEGETAVNDCMAIGPLADAPSLIVSDVLTPEERANLGRPHPSCLAGEYLAVRGSHEVEIARVTLMSTISDVTSVYACPADRLIHYRIVDEYGGETLRHSTVWFSAIPLSLAELGMYLLDVWPLLDVIDRNFGDPDPASAIAFARGGSAFYPEFAQYIDWCISRWVTCRVPPPRPLQACAS